MTALLERPATAAFELIGFEVPAKQSAFGVPAATPCDGDEIRFGGWDDPAAGLTVKFPTTGFRLEAASPCTGDDDAKLVEYRPTSSVDGPVCERATQRGIELSRVVYIDSIDPAVGSPMPRCATVEFGDDGLIKDATS